MDIIGPSVLVVRALITNNSADDVSDSHGYLGATGAGKCPMSSSDIRLGMWDIFGILLAVLNSTR